MKAPSMLIACGLVLCSTLLTRAITAEVPPATARPHAGLVSTPAAFECGGEPCDAESRGLRAFLDSTRTGLDGNGRACADCHMPTDGFQLSPASVEAKFQILQLRRRGNPDADDPLFRPIDPAATKHQTHRPGDQRCVERNVRRRVAHGAYGQRRRPDRARREQPGVAARSESRTP